jgi:hypothetical protein
MPDLARNSADSKRLRATPRAFSSGLGRALSARLIDLSPDVRDLVGKAIDAGIARLVLDASGAPIVARARP